MSDPNSTAEQNARMRARADYFRWLVKYYGSVELAEVTDEPEPVNLRQIFVPMRVDPEAIDESQMVEPSEVADHETETTLPGRDAFELIAEQSFVCLSGLPGSGKTTLTKALIGELCGNHPSPLRTRLAGQRGIAPIPIVLREIKGLERIDSLEQLMEAWWQNLWRQAEQGDSLDIERLRYSFAAEGEAFPLLLLFDGIDETGGPNIRNTLLDIASEAHQKKYRIIITSRPSGFEGLDIPQLLERFDAEQQPQEELIFSSRGLVSGLAETHYYLLPLVWPQIKTFVDRWYRLRPEWEIKRRDGGDHFLQALQDPNRPHLLTLARRPIFLTLMALVHCTRNEMPHGRADLYEAIVDLYLNRQERHRQIQYNTKGKTLKAWPAQEKRRVLARIAYQSQILGAEQAAAQDNPDQRRIVWQQTDLLAFIETFLQQRAGSGGISPEDAADLLEYYLHPAGLLISPRVGEISFAHLSFQEYLCAEDIQRRLSGAKFDKVFREEVAERLGKPGWDEVALLLLAMHKNRSDDGHLELLALLRLNNKPETRLLLQAVCGKELSLTERQQTAWLPAMVAACLLHPYYDLGRWLRECSALVEPGLALAKELLRRFANDPESLWNNLQAQIADRGVFGEQIESALSDTPDSWMNPSWNERNTLVAAHLESLLLLLIFTRWGLGDDVDNPIADSDLPVLLAETINPDLLWWRNNGDLPLATEAGMALDTILPDKGLLWRQTVAALPADACLLQGESADDLYLMEFSQACTLLTLVPRQTLPPRASLAVGLYQVLVLLEYLPLYDVKLDRLRSRPRFQSLPGALARLRLQSLSQSWLRSWLRSRSQSQLLTLSWTQSQLSRLPLPLLLPPQSLNISSVLKKQLAECYESVGSCPDSVYEAWVKHLELFYYRYASRDWFIEQVEDPDLMRRRGLRPGEPLPRELGLFDERGLPLPQQDRRNWLKLQAWLQDDDAMLGFWFPEGLSAEDDRQLREDLAIVKRQPWCPQAFIAAALAEWPEHKPFWDFSFETAEQEMLTACEQFLAAHSDDKPEFLGDNG